MHNETRIERINKLRSQLENERTSFISHWRSLAEYILPRRPRFEITDVNKGDRRNNKIIDSTATISLRTLRSGMMGGITSPARPWFRLTTPDPALAEQSDVRFWLDDVTRQMRGIFTKSNLYTALPITYGDLGCFGTGALFVEEDFDEMVRFYPLPIGSYMVANDAKGRVNVLIRDMQMTVRQMVEKFGKKGRGGEMDWSNFSSRVKGIYDNGQMETFIDVVHVVQPNEEYDENKIGSKHKKFYSCYYEKNSVGEGKFLRESGYDNFPCLVPRWEVTGEDSYGTDCPGMSSLGDVRQLQLGERRLMQAIEAHIMPPLQGPAELKKVKVSMLPGDVTFSAGRESGLKPIHEVRVSINELESKQAQVRERVREAFFTNLFLMMAYSDRREITAREIDERHEEKLLALGPVYEQVSSDLLDPLIDIVFSIMARRRMLPEIPEELQGIDLKVEYVSIMAQAQKMIGLSSLERFSNFIVGVASGTQDPSVLDKVDKDQLIDEYGDGLGVPSSVIRSDDDVEEVRVRRAEEAAQQVSPDNIQKISRSAKDLAGAKLDDENVLSKLVGQVS